MKKVLIVMSSMGAGGAEKSLVSFLSCANPELQKEYDVSIYAKSKEKTLERRIKKLQAKILRLQNEQAQSGLKVTDGTD